MIEPEADTPDDDDKTRFDPTSFVGLVIELGAHAQILLGVIDNPVTKKKEPVDLPRAKTVIDLLGMLEKKTLGNLTDDEVAFLGRILADLRMRFVQATTSRQ